MLSQTDGNLKAIAAMALAMASFSTSDVLVKIASDALPLGEIIAVRNGFSIILVLAFGLVYGGLRVPSGAPTGLLGVRMAAEVLSTLLFLGSLIAMAIADALAIAQITPLVVTAAGAIFLGEHVGWRRWLAALAGLAGVLIILRPGTGAFSLAGLMALASVITVALRDIVTRKIPNTVPTLSLTLMSTAATFASGFLLLPWETWLWPSAGQWLALATAGVALTLAYGFITIAMRSGDIAAASPFRYLSMLFALLAGYFIWDQLPDALSMIGIGIVIAAGLYTLHRERQLKKPQSLATATPEAP